MCTHSKYPCSEGPTDGRDLRYGIVSRKYYKVERKQLVTGCLFQVTFGNNSLSLQATQNSNETTKPRFNTFSNMLN